MSKLVLVCVVTLAVASSIGLGLLSPIAPSMDAASSTGFLEILQVTRTMTQRILPLGDPINDPKPNNLKH